MRIHRRKEESEGLPLTPLIDVVFLLLIFFLTATSFYKKEKDIKVDPPRATEGRAAARRRREITVNIRSEADGGLFVVDGRVVSLPRLNDMIRKGVNDDPGLVVIIRGDKQTYLQRAVDVLNACEKAKVKSYFIATTFEQPRS